MHAETVRHQLSLIGLIAIGAIYMTPLPHTRDRIWRSCRKGFYSPYDEIL